MKKFTVLMGAAAMLMLGACTDSKMEERVSSLEERIAKLEGPASRLETSPASNTTTATPEPTKPDGPLPAFAFEEEEFNFGTIEAGEVIEHQFEFTNTGDAELVIQSATASCGCTVPTYTKQPIAPGETGNVSVRYNSKNKMGQQSPTVTITANTFPAVKRVKLRGTVVAPASEEGNGGGGPVGGK